MQAPKDTYLDDETYAALREELNRLVAQPLVHDADTEIVRILGEVGGIWPKFILAENENMAA